MKYQLADHHLLLEGTEKEPHERSVPRYMYFTLCGIRFETRLRNIRLSCPPPLAKCDLAGAEIRDNQNSDKMCSGVGGVRCAEKSQEIAFEQKVPR